MLLSLLCGYPVPTPDLLPSSSFFPRAVSSRIVIPRRCVYLLAARARVLRENSFQQHAVLDEKNSKKSVEALTAFVPQTITVFIIIIIIRGGVTYTCDEIFCAQIFAIYAMEDIP